MKKILLADDEESIQVAYSRLLESPGVAVEVVGCVESAQNCLESQQYAAIIVDLRLQGTASMPGLSLVRSARKTQLNCFSVVMTAYGDKQTEDKAIDAGADLFLEKPVSPGILKNLFADRNIYSS